MEWKDIAIQFVLKGKVTELIPYGNGHINDTYLVTTITENGKKVSYILQRINTVIFTEPEKLMQNICKVTDFLRQKIAETGKDAARGTLTVIPTKEGKPYFTDLEHNCYRMYTYIENTISLEQIDRAQDFYAAAAAFGEFRYLLSDYPADTLYETIPDFHNTPKRYERFLEVLEIDKMGRAKEVQEEIAYVKERSKEMEILCDALRVGEIPLCVTHNDTKLNNILLDKETGEAICIIDLDTVMPGSSLYDIGDSIRFGASTAAEDEKNLELVKLDLTLFECYVRGYSKGCKGTLTNREYELLPMGAKLMTLECGMRFLTDYLEGDVYFKIHREKHNLDRCRTQLALVADMERKWEKMKQIVEEVRV